MPQDTPPLGQDSTTSPFPIKDGPVVPLPVPTGPVPPPPPLVDTSVPPTPIPDFWQDKVRIIRLVLDTFGTDPANAEIILRFMKIELESIPA